jgi:hypothetical protein
MLEGMTMTIRVIEAPEPIVLPADLGVSYAGDPMALVAIAAATGDLDGPLGSLGRCFGPQTLELVTRDLRGCTLHLPCPPLIDVVSISYRAHGSEGTIDPATYKTEGGSIVFASGSWPKFCLDSLIVRYRAGYDVESTGAVPEQVRQAIVLKATTFLRVLDQSVFQKAEEVEGVGRFEFALPEQVGNVVSQAVDQLVGGLKVIRI